MAVRVYALLLLLCGYGYAQKFHCQRDTYTASDLPSLELPDQGSYIVGVKPDTRMEVLHDCAITGVDLPQILKKMFMGTLTATQVTALMNDARVEYVECDGIVTIAKKSVEDATHVDPVLIDAEL
jgi:hypothetical protein